MSPFFCDAAKLIPHRGPMKLIQRIIDPDENGITAEASVDETWPLCNHGAVSSMVCLELIGQSMCALSTWLRGQGARPRIGLLVGVKEMWFPTLTIPVGSHLTIRVDKISVIGNYGLYSGGVTCGPVSFAKAVVQGIEPEREVIDALYETGRMLKEGKHFDI